MLISNTCRQHGSQANGSNSPDHAPAGSKGVRKKRERISSSKADRPQPTLAQEDTKDVNQSPSRDAAEARDGRLSGEHLPEFSRDLHNPPASKLSYVTAQSKEATRHLQDSAKHLPWLSPGG